MIKRLYSEHYKSNNKKDLEEFSLVLSEVVTIFSYRDYEDFHKYFGVVENALEIGVASGIFSEIILNYLKPKKLFLLDPWDIQSIDVYTDSQNDVLIQKNNFIEVITKFKKEIENENIIIIRDYSPQGLNIFKDGSLDWIYIDGNHSYETVRNDIEIAYKKIKKTGWICGHDIDWPGVRQAIYEFCITTGNKIEAFTDQGGSDSFVIRILK